MLVLQVLFIEAEDFQLAPGLLSRVVEKQVFLFAETVKVSPPVYEEWSSSWRGQGSSYPEQSRGDKWLDPWT